jgi:hypothetical protein
MSRRVIAGLAMGTPAAILILLLAPIVPGNRSIVASLVFLVLIATTAAVVLTVVRSTSLQVAWRRLCLAGGAMSVALGVMSLGLRGQPEWPFEGGYEREIARSIGSMPPADVLWFYATYLGIGAVILGIVLIAVSYWLFPPHRPGNRQVQ